MPSFIACRPSMIDVKYSPSLLLDISSSRRLITQGMRNINRSRPGRRPIPSRGSSGSLEIFPSALRKKSSSSVKTSLVLDISARTCLRPVVFRLFNFFLRFWLNLFTQEYQGGASWIMNIDIFYGTIIMIYNLSFTLNLIFKMLALPLLYSFRPSLLPTEAMMYRKGLQRHYWYKIRVICETCPRENGDLWF